MNKALLVALTVVVLISLAIADLARGIEPRTGRRERWAAKPTIEQRRPNVLMFVTDDQRYVGTMAALPSVQKWFGDRGTEFTNAYATTPLCCPSRASILTGRYPHNHQVYENGMDAVEALDFKQTLPAYLKRAGYRTALFGKYFNSWPGELKPRHFDRWAVSGFKYFDAPFNVQGRERIIKSYATDYLTDLATDYVARSAQKARPWFLYVAPLASHSPYQPEKTYAQTPVPLRPKDASVDEEDRSDKPPWVANKPGAPAERLRRVYQQQLRTLMSVDDMVDEVMTTLEQTGQGDDTIALFMSDNGFLWGEHRLGNKRHPYLPSVHVPMFLRWPGRVAPGAVDGRLAANIDVLPTLLDAAGLEGRKPLDGLSLLGAERREALFLEYKSAFKEKGKLPSWAALLTPVHHYIQYYGPKDRLIYSEYYDLTEDPAELLNLLGDRDPSNDPPRALQNALDGLVRQGRRCEGRDCNLPAPPLGT